MKRNNIIRSVFVVIAIVLYASMAMASETYLLDPRASTEGQEIEINELDHELFHDEIEEIMRYEGIDYNEAENKFFNEGYNRVIQIMRDEDISYDEAKEKFFEEEKVREEEEKVREEKEWEHYEEILYREFRTEGMDDEEARKEAKIITYMNRYDVSEEEAKKALGLEETEESTTEEISGASVDEFLAYLEGLWKLDKGDISFVEAIRFYEAGGCTVEYSIDGETGGLRVVINGEFDNDEPLSVDWLFVRIDDNHVSLTQKNTDIPTKTYERHIETDD